MIRRRVELLWILALGMVITEMALASDTPNPASYAYATNGIKDHIAGRMGSEWKLLLDDSNLGGKELEMVEVTLAPGTIVPSHMHGSVEVIYVLSGTYEHEVNGKRYSLTPGMVGIVRPGDKVRHLVPKSGPAKLLIIWAPGGEANRVLGHAKGTEVRPLDPIATASPPSS
ncbi:MAG TPA: cupin domain-containing protein [Steroidobacteraceae bacterium]|jgi:quercetin dioxygenase-like cupin family protein|nr:cupin domain-containing protein [Steroidobacteraceae bacterium]